ncbi:hypothetical protein ACJJTC_009407 [Scirpophaga incertulas]
MRAKPNLCACASQHPPISIDRNTPGDTDNADTNKSDSQGEAHIVKPTNCSIETDGLNGDRNTKKHGAVSLWETGKASMGAPAAGIPSIGLASTPTAGGYNVPSATTVRGVRTKTDSARLESVAGRSKAYRSTLTLRERTSRIDSVAVDRRRVANDAEQTHGSMTYAGQFAYLNVASQLLVISRCCYWIICESR